MGEEQRFVFDLNAVTYNEVQKLDILDPGEQEEYSISLVVKSLVKWPFEADVSKTAVGELGLLDFMELQNAFSAALEIAFKRDE